MKGCGRSARTSCRLPLNRVVVRALQQGDEGEAVRLDAEGSRGTQRAEQVVVLGVEHDVVEGEGLDGVAV